MKVLNLYACLGGNRYKWNEVKSDIQVTAVEMDPYLAEMYKERFPSDNVIVGDAHLYLLEHFEEYEFIWTSPPCPSHSRVRITQKNKEFFTYKYPDMKLYEEIIFLDNFFKGKYCVENVIPYYEPLIPAQKRGRHLYWTNYRLPNILTDRKVKISEGKNEVKKLCEFHEYDFYQYKGEQPLNKIARNLVDYQAGKTIFEVAVNAYYGNKTNQLTII